MTNRARFETDKGHLTLSRGLLTLRDGESGKVQTLTTAGDQFAPGELAAWRASTISVDVYENRERVALTFKISKNPREIREENLREFAPVERGRLQGVVDSSAEGDERGVAEAALAAFTHRYGQFLPVPKTTAKKQNKKKGRKAQEES